MCSRRPARLSGLLFAAGILFAPSASALSLAATDLGSSFIRDDGTLWGWGYNAGFHPGGIFPIVRSDPQQLATGVKAASGGFILKLDGSLLLDNGDGYKPFPLDGVVAMATAGHTLFLRSDGTVWARGSNSSGQLGVVNAESFQYFPVHVLSDAVAIAAGNNQFRGFNSKNWH